MSTNHLFSDFLTPAGADNPMTTEFVASESFPTHGLPNHGISLVYDPDESDGVCDAEVQISDDPKEVADSASNWRTLGVASRSTAVVTYAADTLRLSSSAAGTKKYLAVVYRDEPGQKIRIRRKETFTGAGSNQGNLKAVGYSFRD